MRVECGTTSGWYGKCTCEWYMCAGSVGVGWVGAG